MGAMCGAWPKWALQSILLSFAASPVLRTILAMWNPDPVLSCHSAALCDSSLLGNHFRIACYLKYAAMSIPIPGRFRRVAERWHYQVYQESFPIPKGRSIVWPASFCAVCSHLPEVSHIRCRRMKSDFIQIFPNSWHDCFTSVWPAKTPNDTITSLALLKDSMWCCRRNRIPMRAVKKRRRMPSTSACTRL